MHARPPTPSRRDAECQYDPPIRIKSPPVKAPPTKATHLGGAAPPNSWTVPHIQSTPLEALARTELPRAGSVAEAPPAVAAASPLSRGTHVTEIFADNENKKRRVEENEQANVGVPHIQSSPLEASDWTAQPPAGSVRPTKAPPTMPPAGSACVTGKLPQGSGRPPPMPHVPENPTPLGNPVALGTTLSPSAPDTQQRVPETAAGPNPLEGEQVTSEQRPVPTPNPSPPTHNYPRPPPAPPFGVPSGRQTQQRPVPAAPPGEPPPRGAPGRNATTASTATRGPQLST